MRAIARGARRRGMTAAAVLVCLVVLTMIAGTLLRIGVVRRDALRTHEREVQAEWLARAGLERGIARLASDAKYAGETWKPSRGDLDLPGDSGGRDQPAAVVRITIEPAGDGPGGTKGSLRRIAVQADYPPDAPRRARSSLQVSFDPGSPKTGASR
ncbi:hypothetical protein OJF2_56090 [Aquisphaera giovannonii]|uniref:Uncharacterized protein n=1 Tax=Aquisphaera giovannonii TaxID=406548 RepID=A0A5B9W9T2_9BACT|nr:hypothetical protein [Aquisphaera giovannonii]QEH37024.1 hypothetical protein OJF2_56090 [Aquisphaera giovannonii]